MALVVPQVSAAVVGELVDRLGPQFTAKQIEECINTAAADLAGSVSSESLPEMAIRLALVRLSGESLPAAATESASGTSRSSRRDSQFM